MSSVPKTFLTPEQYLEIERKAEFKSEYYNGEMFPMGEARPHNVIPGVHSLIKTNVSGQLYLQLRSRPCRVYGSDQRVSVSAGLYTYPAVVVACGEPRLLDGPFDPPFTPPLLPQLP